MNKKMKATLLALFDEMDTIAATEEIPHHFASVVDSIIVLEFKQELVALRAMLLNIETFEEQFKQRCNWRAVATDQAIPFSAMPESITNKLYWTIADLVFKPATMKNMLNIILPDTKVHIKIPFPKSNSVGLNSDEFRNYMRRIEPALEPSNGLDELTDLPSISALSHYIFSGDMFFDARDIERLSLRHHAKIQRDFQTNYPQLAENLYVHNSKLQTLANDILTLNNKGITPKTAIEQLIQGFITGGSQRTGSRFASQSAEEARKRFFDYFNALTSETKKSLRALKSDNKSLGRLIDEVLEKGHCVETTAIWLTQFLKDNSHDPLLNSPPRITRENLKILENKYRVTELLDSKKDSVQTPALPAQLTKKAIQSIAPKTHEEWIFLLLNFPPAFYDDLWHYVSFVDANQQLISFAARLKQGFFNLEHRHLLIKVITKYYQRFNLEESILFWTARLNDPKLVYETLASWPKHQRLEVIRMINKFGNTVLHLVACDLEPLSALLTLLPEYQRLDAITVRSKYGHKVIHYSKPSGISKGYINPFARGAKNGCSKNS